MLRRSDRRLYGWEWDIWVAREELVTSLPWLNVRHVQKLGTGLFSGKTEGF